MTGDRLTALATGVPCRSTMVGAVVQAWLVYPAYMAHSSPGSQSSNQTDRVEGFTSLTPPNSACIGHQSAIRW